MSAAAKAEARKKALLSRGNERLSKLTTSARGEDHPVYSHADTSTRKAPTTETFVGEESVMPTPPARVSPTPGPRVERPAGSTQPSVWTNEQQQEFLHALMSAPDAPSTTAGSSYPFAAAQASFESGPESDPMSAMMNALSQFTDKSGQALPESVEESVPRSSLSKLRPFLHLIASWTLLVFFAFFMEPQAHDIAPDSFASSIWDRWSELAKRNAKHPFGVQPIAFFWAFVTLQLVLHSIQIFTKSDPVRPPTFLAMVLPSLPPSWRSMVTNVLVYARMLGMLLDDIAGLVVGIGILVWISVWITGGR